MNEGSSDQTMDKAKGGGDPQESLKGFRRPKGEKGKKGWSIIQSTAPKNARLRQKVLAREKSLRVYRRAGSGS